MGAPRRSRVYREPPAPADADFSKVAKTIEGGHSNRHRVRHGSAACEVIFELTNEKMRYEMIINLGDGVIAAMPDDAVDCGYDENNVFTSAASPRQYHGNSLAVTSVRRQADCGYNMNNVFKQPAAPPLAY